MERQSGRCRWGAGGGAAGLLAIPQAVPAQAAVPNTLTRCTDTQHDLSFTPSPAARLIAQGECDSTLGGGRDGEGAGLWVKIYRSGTLVWSGGDGVGIVTATYNCQGNAMNDFLAVWSTGQSDEQSFPCG